MESVWVNVKTTSEERAQAVLDIKEHDLTGQWGVAQVRQRLANQGILIKWSENIVFIFYNYEMLMQPLDRDELQQVLHDHFDAEFNARFVGMKGRLNQVLLISFGPWHQFHADGHEKLSHQALGMGEDASLPIYAFKDQFSSFVPYMCVLPDVRHTRTVGHVFLDLVEIFGHKVPHWHQFIC